MTGPAGPRFLDDDPPEPPHRPPSPVVGRPGSDGAEPLPRGPVLLEAAPDASDRLELGWMPEVVAPPLVRIGAIFWAATGLCAMVFAWAVLSLISFVIGLFAQSLLLGGVGAVIASAAAAMIAYAVTLEVRAYRSLSLVEELRATLADPAAPVAILRERSKRWLSRIRAELPDAAAVERLLDATTTPAELRAVLRSQIADRLHEAARKLGRRAAVEGATVVAICPHAAWDGIVAGARALLVIRQIAALFGLRPGLAVTLTLVRRAAAAAAATTGITLVAQGLAEEALKNVPGIKHLSGALGASTVAVRLYRLATVTAQACSPV